MPSRFFRYIGHSDSYYEYNPDNNRITEIYPGRKAQVVRTSYTLDVMIACVNGKSHEEFKPLYLLRERIELAKNKP